MTTQTPTTFLLRSSLALIIAMALGASAIGQPADTTEAKPLLQDQAPGADEGMASQRHQMMEDMRAQDIELTKAVAKMNSATKDKKMALMADIITQMVKQRAETTSRMEEIQEQVTHYMLAMKGLSDKRPTLPKDRSN
jgi:hypothetical protein